ncbi:MAG: hypothetical protein QOE33_3132 [Acidobacteriota bacterium]|nr:hypothetical protein [Acidobacteriota bacterium]
MSNENYDLCRKSGYHPHFEHAIRCFEEHGTAYAEISFKVTQAGAADDNLRMVTKRVNSTYY